jgi:hypothetical protein
MAFFGGASVANLVGATSSVAGTAGLVPAPSAGNSTRVLLSNANFRDSPLVPPYKITSSVFLSPVRFFAQGLSNVAQAAKVRYFGIGSLPVDGEINTIAYRVGGAPASSINVHVAIWKVASDGLPGDYVGGAIIASGTTANTDISASLSPTLSVNSGLYYFSVTPESLLNSFSGQSTRVAESMYLGCFGSMGGAGRIPQYTATTYDQTTHNAFTFTTDTVPQVGVRYA